MCLSWVFPLKLNEILASLLLLPIQRKINRSWRRSKINNRKKGKQNTIPFQILLPSGLYASCPWILQETCLWRIPQWFCPTIKTGVLLPLKKKKIQQHNTTVATASQSVSSWNIFNFTLHTSNKRTLWYEIWNPFTTEKHPRILHHFAQLKKNICMLEQALPPAQFLTMLIWKLVFSRSKGEHTSTIVAALTFLLSLTASTSFWKLALSLSPCHRQKKSKLKSTGRTTAVPKIKVKTNQYVHHCPKSSASWMILSYE